MHGETAGVNWLSSAVASYALAKATVPRSIPPEVLRLAAGSGLLGVVVHQLRASDREVPPEALAWNDGLALAKLAQRADLAVLARCLDEAAVRWVVVKGPVLDQVTYRVPGLRSYADIDVLVHPADFTVAWDALKHVPADDLDLNWARLAATKQSEISLRLPHGSLLDLHWHVISNSTTRTQMSLDVRRFFDERVLVQVDGRDIPTLSARDTYLYVALHAALSGGHELRWGLDVHQAAARCPDHDAVASRAADLGLTLVARVMGDRSARALSSAPVWRLPVTGPSRSWVLLCQLVGRFMPATVGAVDRYTGRAILGSTRRSLSTSLTATARAVWVALRTGRSRRTTAIDRRPLREPGGTVADLEQWLDAIRREADRPEELRTARPGPARPR